jgi:hypothetical protein
MLSTFFFTIHDKKNATLMEDMLAIMATLMFITYTY